jgi:hypothetical protein
MKMDIIVYDVFKSDDDELGRGMGLEYRAVQDKFVIYLFLQKLFHVSEVKMVKIQQLKIVQILKCFCFRILQSFYFVPKKLPTEKIKRSIFLSNVAIKI